MPIVRHYGHRTKASKFDKKGRALTVYFATKEEKKTFDQIAKGFGLSSSGLGTMMLHAGMRDGFRALAAEREMVVHSEAQNPDQGESTARKRTRPSSLLDRLKAVFVRRQGQGDD